MSKPITPDKWKWYGNAGHFICGHRCRFHLTTKVGSWVISTVGELPSSREDVDFETIGSGLEIYETMAFRIKGSCDCGCGLPMINGTSKDSDRYMTAKEATKGHYAMCRKLSKG